MKSKITIKDNPEVVKAVNDYMKEKEQFKKDVESGKFRNPRIDEEEEEDIYDAVRNRRSETFKTMIELSKEIKEKIDAASEKEFSYLRRVDGNGVADAFKKLYSKGMESGYILAQSALASTEAKLREVTRLLEEQVKESAWNKHLFEKGAALASTKQGIVNTAWQQFRESKIDNV